MVLVLSLDTQYMGLLEKTIRYKIITSSTKGIIFVPTPKKIEDTLMKNKSF